jgi:hypothetical protein
MTLRRRRFLASVASVTVAVGAGCLGADRDTPAANRSTSNRTTARGTAPRTTERTATESFDDWVAEAEASVDRDKPVVLSNEDETAHTVEVRVTQGDDVVHRGTYDLSPGTLRREVFNTKSLDGPGNVPYEARASVGEQSARVHFETDECHSGPEFVVSDGELAGSMAIC